MPTILQDYLKVKRTEKTRGNVKSSLKKFLNWKYNTAFESLERMEPLAARYLAEYRFQDIVEYLLWMRDTIEYQPTTISTYLGYILKFLEYHDKIISKSERAKLRSVMPRAVTVTQDRPFTREIIATFCSESDGMLRSIILLAVSSGMRLNEILHLELSEIEFGNPNKIRMPKSKMKQGRPHTYRFSDEAAFALREWLVLRDVYEQKRLKLVKPECRSNLQERSSTLVYPVSSSTVYCRWRRLLEQTGLSVQDPDSGRFLYSTHGCRRWFSSTASRYLQHEIVEALIGHDTGLSSAYRRYPEDDLDKEYLKVEPYLSIFITDDFVDISENMAEILHALVAVTTKLTTSVHNLCEMIDELKEEREEEVEKEEEMDGEEKNADR